MFYDVKCLNMEIFKDWLDRHVSGAGLTNEEFAEKIGGKQSSISQWLSGKHLPKPPVLLRIASVTNEDWRVLFHMVYGSPLPEGDNGIDPRIGGIMRRAEGMSDDELQELESYIDFIMASRARKAKAANEGDTTRKDTGKVKDARQRGN